MFSVSAFPGRLAALQISVRAVTAVFLLLAVSFPAGHYLEAQVADGSDAQLYERIKEGASEDLVEVRPAIQELIQRIGSAPERQSELETLFFLMALSYQDEYSQKEDKALLENAVQYYERYLENFPAGARRDFVRFNLGGAYADLDNFDKAVENYEWLYRRSENAALRTESRDRMARLYIKHDKAAEGIPLFLEVFNAAVLDRGLRAQAASWLLQGYLDSGETEKIQPYLRYLTGRYEAIYDPQFNITLLKAGDDLFGKEKFDQAILLYNFVKPRDAIIAFYEELVSEIRQKLRYIDQDTEQYTVTESRLKTAQANLEAVREIRSYNVDMQWRIARVYRRTNRSWEALWAFYHLYEDSVDNPEQGENIENFLFIAFEEAMRVSDDTMVERLAKEYLAVADYTRFRDEVTLGLAGYYNRKGRYDELLALAGDYLESPRSFRVAAQLINYAGNYFIRQRSYRRLNEYMSARIDGLEGKEPAYEAARYWTGLSHILLADYKRASDVFGRFLEDYSDRSNFHEDVFYRYAIALYGEQKAREAEEQFTAFAEKYPGSNLRGEAELYLGDLKRDRGALGAAAEHYRSVDRHTDNSGFISKAAFALAEVLKDMGRHNEAIETLQDYVGEYGQTGELAEAYRRIGLILDRRGSLRERFELHSEAIRQMGNDAERYAVDDLIQNYVDDYLRYERSFRDSRELLERLIRDDAFREKFVNDRAFQYQYMQSPEGRYVDHELSHRLIRDRDFRATIKETEIETDAAGNEIPPKGKVVTEEMAESVLEEQLEKYEEKAASIEPFTPRAIFPNLLETARANDQLVLEMRARMAMDKLSGEAPEPHFTMEQLREAPPAVLVWEANKREESKPEDAKALYQLVMDEHPFSDSVYDALVASGEMAIREAEASGDHSDWEEALKYYNLLTERFAMRADSAQPFLRKGRILSELGRDQKAIDVLGMVLRNPAWKGLDHAKAHLELGLAYRRQGKLGEAHGFFERLIVAYGGFAETVAWAYYFDMVTLEEMGETESVQQLIEEYKTRLAVLSETEAHQMIDEKYL